jgi:hypothetical protein
VPGSVTLVTCLPACNVIGAVANRYVTIWSWPLDEFRYGIRAATTLPNCTPCLPPPSVQSPKPIWAVCAVPSEYPIVTVPEALPSVPLPRKDSFVAVAGVADRSSFWSPPAARMLSGTATGSAGQANVNPPALTCPPGLTPAATSACAE